MHKNFLTAQVGFNKSDLIQVVELYWFELVRGEEPYLLKQRNVCDASR